MRAARAGLRNLERLVPVHAFELAKVLASLGLLGIEVHEPVGALHDGVARRRGKRVALTADVRNVGDARLGNAATHLLLDLAPELARVGLLGRVG